ncbi:MAG: hypothetical protein WBL79_11795, partial [Bacillota bacterium]
FLPYLPTAAAITVKIWGNVAWSNICQTFGSKTRYLHEARIGQKEYPMVINGAIALRLVS